MGASLVAAAVVIYFGTLVVRRTLPTWCFDAGIGAGGALALAGGATGGAWAIAGSTAGTSLLWFVLTRRELGLPRGGGAVRPGDVLPGFRAQTTAGLERSAADVVAAAPAVLVIYRGWWCPYCVSQLGELERHHERLRAAGLTLFALSVDPPEEQRPLEQRLGGRITFLSDPSGTALDALGVRVPDGVPWYDRWIFGARKQDIGRPLTLGVGADGRLWFVHRAARIDDRPSPGAIVEAWTESGPKRVAVA